MIGDALRSSLALALRLEGDLKGWHRREGHSSSAAARELARLTVEIATQMRSEVESLLKDHGGGQTPDLDAIVALNQRAVYAEELHGFLDSSTHRSLHPVLSPTVRTELVALNVPGRVLVAGMRDVSYEVWTFARDNFVGLVPDATLDTFEWPFFVFRVPNEPLDWPLHHVLLYHEIGHAILGAKGALPTLAIPSDYDPTGTTNLTEALERMRRAEIYQRASAYWLEELYADAVGLCLAGPSYIVAFARLLGTFFQLDLATETHPPVALRIKLLVGSLSQVGFSAALPSEVQELLEGWLKASETVKSRPSSVELQAIVETLAKNVEATHAETLKLALDHVGTRKYTENAFLEDWERGRLLASLHIPPIEREGTPSVDAAGEPLPPSRVFSSCWAAYLLGAASDGRAADRYAEAILGSLEGVEALRIWRSP